LASAEYFDGTTAARRAVVVSLTERDLLVHDLAGNALAAWPIGQLRRIDQIDGVLRLTDGVGEARLALADAALIAALTARAPQLRPAKALSPRGLRTAAIIAACVVLALAGGLIALPRALDALVFASPRAWERPIGTAGMRQLVGSDGVCVGEAGRRALDRLLVRLAGRWASEIDLSVIVVDASTVNAFALPGGQLAILRGLIDQATTPEEVAAVLAHEIGHAIERHGMRKLARAYGLALVASLVSGGVVADIGASLIESTHSREFEREADSLAHDMLVEAGISTSGMADYFERQSNVRGMPGFVDLAYFRSHPTDRERADAARRRARSGSPALTSDEWRAVRTICEHTVSVRAALGLDNGGEGLP
jgi:Zn-dependent protease with chaperone function